MSKLQVQKNVPKPEGIATRRSNGQEKYPFEEMKEVGDFFLVPWQWYFGDGAENPDRERWVPKQHRERVNNAARGYALKMNKAESKKEGFDKENFKPLQFTVAALHEGIGVWRDQ